VVELMRWHSPVDLGNRADLIHDAYDRLWLDQAQSRIRGGSEQYTPNQSLLTDLRPDERQYLLDIVGDKIPGDVNTLLTKRFGPRTPHREPEIGTNVPNVADIKAARLRRGPSTD
jgi:hypothetical protein